jgi:hypothetical protein
MPLPKHFAINPKRVVHETIDGETIIIQLESGSYYSLAGPGAEIWTMLAGGSSTDEAVADLERRYDESPQALSEATLELVRELRREELLEDDPNGPAQPQTVNGASNNGSTGERAQFGRPTLQKYTDMQHFLVLDPIHEVEGSGWPNPPSEQTAP